jgi:hypothetical protein
MIGAAEPQAARATINVTEAMRACWSNASSSHQKGLRRIWTVNEILGLSTYGLPRVLALFEC